MQDIDKWVKTHRKGIVIALGSAVVVGGAVWILKNTKIINLKNIINNQNEIIVDQVAVIDYLKELCVEKEVSRLKIASDALRHGSSEGALALVEWREFMKDTLMVA